MEIQNNTHSIFKSIDTTGDGKLSKSEMKAAESIFGEGFFDEAEDGINEQQFTLYLIQKSLNQVKDLQTVSNNNLKKIELQLLGTILEKINKNNPQQLLDTIKKKIKQEDL